MDTDWINNSLHLYENNNNLVKSTQPFIKTLFIYVNSDNNIEKINSDILDISNNTISTKKLFNIILNHKFSTSQFVYNFDYLSLFSIPIQHENIFDFNYGKYDYASFISTFSINSDIVIPSTLHIFHKFTTLFFFFKKRFLDVVPKSILVTPSNKSTKPKKTKKKVKIVEQKFRKTKKSI